MSLTHNLATLARQIERRLSAEQIEQARTICHRHISACQRFEVPSCEGNGGIARVYLEALQAVERGDRLEESISPADLYEQRDYSYPELMQ